MREIRSYGSVGEQDSNVLLYLESPHFYRNWKNYLSSGHNSGICYSISAKSLKDLLYQQLIILKIVNRAFVIVK
jgi:hypothetical protein